MKSETLALAASPEPVHQTTDETTLDPMAAVLSTGECELFARVGKARAVSAGEKLFARGEPGTTMFVILQGSVVLDFGDDLASKRLGPNEFFGELGLLIGDHARSASATVAEDGVLLELQHDEFQVLVDRDAAA